MTNNVGLKNGGIKMKTKRRIYKGIKKTKRRTNTKISAKGD